MFLDKRLSQPENSLRKIKLPKALRTLNRSGGKQTMSMATQERKEEREEHKAQLREFFRVNAT